MTDPQLRIYTHEEIELFLRGDRREIDKLILQQINGLAAALTAHIGHENKFINKIDELGGLAAATKRAEWVDAQIERQKAHNRMMEKVSTSTTAWAVIAFIGYIAFSVKESIVNYLKTKWSN